MEDQTRQLEGPTVKELQWAILGLCVTETGILNKKVEAIPLAIRREDGTVDDNIYLDTILSKDGSAIEKVILTSAGYFKKYSSFYSDKTKSNKGTKS